MLHSRVNIIKKKILKKCVFFLLPILLKVIIIDIHEKISFVSTTIELVILYIIIRIYDSLADHTKRYRFKMQEM